jgi:hypothetical protein
MNNPVDVLIRFASPDDARAFIKFAEEAKTDLGPTWKQRDKAADALKGAAVAVLLAPMARVTPSLTLPPK